MGVSGAKTGSRTSVQGEENIGALGRETGNRVVRTEKGFGTGDVSKNRARLGNASIEGSGSGFR